MATTATPAPERPPLTLDEKAMNLEIARFKLEQSRFDLEKLKYEDSVTAKGHFPIFPPDHPQNVMWAFAEGVLGAKYITEAARDNVNSIFFLLNTAHDLEISWTFALRVIGMTPRGQVIIPGNLMLAILHKKKFKVRLVRNNNDVAEYEIERPDGSLKWSCPITWEQAHNAGWPYGKEGIKEPWKDRANMLRWRSLAYTARVVAADAIGGLGFLAEELDETGNSGLVIDVNAEADKAAESNPALKLEPKAIESTPAGQVIDLPAMSAQELKNEAFLQEQAAKSNPVPPRKRKAADAPAPEPKPVVPAEEIKAMADANAAEHGITDDDLPAVNDDKVVEIPKTDPATEAKAALAKRIDSIIAYYGGTRRTATLFCSAYLGNADEMKDPAKLESVVTVLEKSLAVCLTLPEDEKAKMLAIYVNEPEQFAKNVKVAANPSTPADDPFADMLPLEWTAETRAAAQSAMQKMGLDIDKFARVLTSAGIGALGNEDALAFFKMFYHHPDTTLLLKRCREKKFPLTAALAFVEDELKSPLMDNTNAKEATRAITNCISEVRSMEEGK